MPNPRHFDWNDTDSSLLALPRPSSCPSLGCFVKLKPGAALLRLSNVQSKHVLDGPLAPGDVGQVIDDVGSGEAPFLVQDMLSGRLWWYPEAALQPIPADTAHQDGQQSATLGEGSYVTLVANYKSFTDAARGPLSLLRTEEAYGLVLMESGNRFRVRCCHGDKGDWWYDHGAVRPIHTRYVPEPLRAAVRPRWGDYVALAHDYGRFGTAADGPLEPGNLGVVAAVHDVPDSKGGLARPRYTVRACHNGHAYRYQEGALHLVIPQLLHGPKLAPTTAKKRAQRLSCHISITEACSGDVLPCGQMMIKGQLQQVQQVVPGRRYWIAVTLACKDGDLMLANLKPSTFDLYAATGLPGQYAHLQPVPCKQQQHHQQQQQRGLIWQQQGPELVSLALCNGATGAGGAGSDVWYNATQDEAFCVFEWDSSESPLVLKANRAVSVDFVWAACFQDVPGQAKQQHTVLLQTVAASSRDVSPAATAAAAAAAAASRLGEMAECSVSGLPGSQQQQDGFSMTDELPAPAATVFEWLDHICTTPQPAGASRRNNHGTSDSHDDDCDDDQNNDGDSDTTCSSGTESDEEGEQAAADVAADSRRQRGPRRDRDNPGGGAAGANGAEGRGAGGHNPAGRNSGSSSSGEPGAAAPPTPPASESSVEPRDAGAAAAGGGRDLAGSRPSSTSSSCDGTLQTNAAAAVAVAAGQTVVASQSSGHSSSSVDALQGTCRTQSCPSLVISASDSPATSSQAASAAAGSAGAGTSRSSLRNSSTVAGSRTSSITARASTPITAGNRAAASGAGADRSSSGAVAVGDGSMLNIQEIMRQFEFQAESAQPFWQPGTELAAELAAKAMAAAEEWQRDWCRPRE